jgi:Spy/CpxP family protein refolding chaperone
MLLKRALKFVRPIAVVAVIVGMSACDSSDTSDFESQEIDALYESVSRELSLTTSQSTRFAEALFRHDRSDRSPGYMWTVAAELSEVLTAEQIAGLIERTRSIDGNEPFRGLRGFPGAGGYYGVGGFMGGSGRHGQSPADEIIELTEEQRQAIRAIHEDFRERMKALRDEREAGTSTDEELLREIRSLHDEMRAELDAVLTDDQKAALEEYRRDKEAEFAAFREEVNQVRDAVLGLSAEESEAFDAIMADQLSAREVLFEQFQAGDLELAEFQDEVQALHQARDAALEALLTESQYEIVQIHDALAVRMSHKGHHGRPRNHRGLPG